MCYFIFFCFCICHIIICEYMHTHMSRTRICLREKCHHMHTKCEEIQSTYTYAIYTDISQIHTRVCQINSHVTYAHISTKRYDITRSQIRRNSEHKHTCSIYSYVRNTHMSTGDISPHAYKCAEILSIYTCVTRTLMSQIHMYLQEICHHMHTNMQKSRAILWYRASNYIQQIL